MEVVRISLEMFSFSIHLNLILDILESILYSVTNSNSLGRFLLSWVNSVELVHISFIIRLCVTCINTIELLLMFLEVRMILDMIWHDFRVNRSTWIS